MRKRRQVILGFVPPGIRPTTRNCRFSPLDGLSAESSRNRPTGHDKPTSADTGIARRHSCCYRCCSADDQLANINRGRQRTEIDSRSGPPSRSFWLLVPPLKPSRLRQLLQDQVGRSLGRGEGSYLMS